MQCIQCIRMVWNHDIAYDNYKVYIYFQVYVILLSVYYYPNVSTLKDTESPYFSCSEKRQKHVPKPWLKPGSFQKTEIFAVKERPWGEPAGSRSSWRGYEMSSILEGNQFWCKIYDTQRVWYIYLQFTEEIIQAIGKLISYWWSIRV